MSYASYRFVSAKEIITDTCFMSRLLTSDKEILCHREPERLKATRRCRRKGGAVNGEKKFLRGNDSKSQIYVRTDRTAENWFSIIRDILFSAVLFLLLKRFFFHSRKCLSPKQQNFNCKWKKAILERSVSTSFTIAPFKVLHNKLPLKRRR